MATSKEYKDFILEQLDLLDNITCKPMMGWYLIYYNNILFGGLYGGDNFLVKIVESKKKYSMKEKIPYEGSKKTRYLVEDIDNKEKLKDIVIDTCKGLVVKKWKSRDY